jgi:hypothetical protein
MRRLQIGIVRYLSVARAIGNALGIEPAPYIRIGHRRITLTFRSIGASRWPENQQMELALRGGSVWFPRHRRVEPEILVIANGDAARLFTLRPCRLNKRPRWKSSP